MSIVVGVVVSALAILSLWWTNERKDRLVAVDAECLVLSRSALVMNERAARKIRAFLLTGNERHLSERATSRKRFKQTLDQLEPLLSGEQRSAVQDIRLLDAQLAERSDALLRSREQGLSPGEAGRALERLQPMRDELDARLEDLRSTLEGQFEEARRAAESTERLALLLLASSLLLGIILFSTFLRLVKRAFDEAARQRSRLEEHARFQQRVMGIVGHDLRSPLTAVQTSTEALARDALTSEQERWVDRIGRASRRMAHITELLVGYVQIAGESGLMIIVERRDVRQLCRDAVSEYRAERPDATVQFSWDGSPYADVDEDRVREMLWELLDHAYKSGDGDHRLELLGETHEDEVQLLVRRAGGPPLSVAERDHLFDPFRDQAQDKVILLSGGLGMFLARRIARAHGGDVHARDTQSGEELKVRLSRSLIGTRPPAGLDVD